MDADTDIVAEFLIESHENLGLLEGELVELESDPTATAKIASIFRTIHTIKGTCGFLGFRRLEAVAHAGENLLALLRDEELEYSTAIASGLLAMVDAINRMLSAIEDTGSDGEGDDTGLVADLIRLQRGSARPPPPPARRASMGLVPLPPPAPPAAAPTAPTAAATPAPSASLAPPATPASPHAAADTSIRVDVGLLDTLMNLVGELVLVRNEIGEHALGQSSPTLVAASQRLNLITASLQGGVMKTRMQPIGQAFSKLPRFVRDLAQACGKRVRIQIEGEDTELDRTLLEAIRDPLAHLVRNSVDHGLETPAARLAAGKPVEGTLRLRAFHAGGQVNVEISDDGAGIDCDKIRKKAVARGLFSPEAADRLAERELIGLIFMPGFSTAETVTHVSGRGVGMDVVKTNVERIGGLVDVETRRGAGTLFRVKIPLTLAIVPAVIVSSAGERYAIPQISLLEVVHLAEPEKSVEWIHGAPVYRLRDRLLPLVFLAEVLGGSAPSGGAGLNIVVLSAKQRTFGLVVDEVDDTADIVVKPLGAHLSGIGTYAGATILGDGSVGLILDVQGVARIARIVGKDSAVGVREEDAPPPPAVAEALLVCRTAGAGQIAIPIGAVARLEKIAASQVEHAGTDEVAQVRGEILPLVRLESILPERGARSAPPRAVLDVVVYTDGRRTVGLVVDQVLDIVQEDLVLANRGSRAGVIGTAILSGRVTELLDLGQLLGAAARAPATFEAA